MSYTPSVAMDALVGLPAVLERWEDGHVARLEGVPGIYGRGETEDEALEDLERAVMFTLGAEAWIGGTIDEDDGNNPMEEGAS